MFDSTNPAIILCSHELEEALNIKALHVSEMRSAARSPSYNNNNYIFLELLSWINLKNYPMCHWHHYYHHHYHYHYQG